MKQLYTITEAVDWLAARGGAAFINCGSRENVRENIKQIGINYFEKFREGAITRHDAELPLPHGVLSIDCIQTFPPDASVYFLVPYMHGHIEQELKAFGGK